MARYFFNTSDGHVQSEDTEGGDHADLPEVRAEAIGYVRSMLAEGDRQGLCRRHWQMDVKDEAGALVLSLPFGHALKPDRVGLTTLDPFCTSSGLAA